MPLYRFLWQVQLAQVERKFSTSLISTAAFPLPELKAATLGKQASFP